jgi:hypothetical protein
MSKMAKVILREGERRVLFIDGAPFLVTMERMESGRPTDAELGAALRPAYDAFAKRSQGTGLKLAMAAMLILIGKKNNG